MDFLGQELLRAALEVELIARPSPKDTPATVDAARLGIREAGPTDVSVIRSWIRDEEELAWLGGDLGGTADEHVARWTRASHAPFVLTYRDERAGERPVAFANLAPFGPDSLGAGPELEVGRLVVDPSWRRRGLGSTLLRHLSGVAAVVSSRGFGSGGEPHARVCHDNEAALAMVRRLPFVRDEPPAWAGSEETRIYEWFHFRSHARPSLLGPAVRDLRDRRGLSQAILAFQCGVQRATINMIEAGKRNPSIEVLRSLCAVLAETELDRVRLLLASIGEPPSRSLRAYEPLSSPSGIDHDDLWILADELAEALDARFAEISRQAIALGRNRWYFVPPSVLRERGPELLDLFRGQGITPEMRQRHLRLYEAPSLFCQLRVEVRNPRQFDADSVSVEGEDHSRVPMSMDRAKALLLNLRTIVTAIDDRSRRGEHGALHGFSLCYPYRGQDELTPR